MRTVAKGNQPPSRHRVLFGMDERVLWFAGKLQETFRFGGYDNPSVLEDFLADFEVAELITKFLSPGEPRKLFFYCDETREEEPGRSSCTLYRQLRVTSKITKGFSSSVQNDHVCLYVLRKDPAKEVDISSMDKELYCGEIRQSVLASLSTLLSNAYSPLLHSQSDWGECSKESVLSFLTGFDKLTTVIQEMATQSLSHEPLLRQPSPSLKSLLMHFQVAGNRINLSDKAVSECETVMADWIAVIEGLLIDTTDERIEDPLGLPLAEKQKWERRQILLFSVIEQLKWRESTAVIATLAAAKSKHIKKWRQVDTQLTEAFNGCKDKVWYLTGLQSQLDTVQSVTTPSILSNEVLPTIISTIKQMEGLSRLFARTGYIAVVLKKISNQFTFKCQDMLFTGRQRQQGGGGGGGQPTSSFWDLIFKDEREGVPHSPLPLPLKELTTTLKEVIELGNVFKEAIHHLKDTLLMQQTYTGTGGGGVGGVANKRPIAKQLLVGRGATGGGAKKGCGLGVGSTSMLQAWSETLTEGSSIPHIQSGLSLTMISDIMTSLADLSERCGQVLSLIESVQTLKGLWPRLKGLPRLRGVWEKPTEERSRGEELDDEEEGSTCSLSPQSVSSLLLYSEEERDSVSCLVRTVLSAMRGHFESRTPEGVKQVFAVSGRDKVTFDPLYVKFEELLRILQEHICTYLTTLILHVKESSRSLDILSKFDLISSWSLLQPTLHQCLMIAFKKYSNELNLLQKCYENDKKCPPLPRGRAPLMGAVEWARGLLKRVEDPMQVFREDGMLMKTPESHHVCTLHNRLATTLIQYETLLIKQLKEKIDKTLHLMITAPLLRLEDNDEGKTIITVNSDNGLLQLIEESKAMKQLGVSLSSPAQLLLGQEGRIKQFNQHLQYSVTNLTTTIDMIDDKLNPLFHDTIDTVLRFYLPGWTTLTWSSLNIDPYLHLLEMSTKLLQSSIERCNDVLSSRVYPLINDITHIKLINIDLATSKVWVPHDFSEAMSSHVHNKVQEMICKVAQIKTALFEIFGEIQLTHKQLQKLHSEHSNNMSKSKDFIPIAPAANHAPLTRGGVKKHKKTASLKLAPKGHTSSTLSTKKKSKETPFTDAMQRVLFRFSTLVQVAIGQLICSSISSLYGTVCEERGGGKEREGGEGEGTGGSQSLNNKGEDIEEDSHTVLSHSPIPSSQLQLQLELMLYIPNMVLVPNIREVYDIVINLLLLIAGLFNEVETWGHMDSEEEEGEEERLIEDNRERVVDAVHDIKTKFKNYFEALAPQVSMCTDSLKIFDHLWKEDLCSAHNRFQRTKPRPSDWKSKVLQLVETENKILAIPSSLSFGPLQLITSPLKSTLRSLSSNWKTQFSSHLHLMARTALQTLVEQQMTMSQVLTSEVYTGDLAFLREVLELLEHMDDLHHSIDDQYLPVEEMYMQLKEFGITLERKESEEVEGLRRRWNELSDTANRVKNHLLVDQRLIHIQETVKQVKEFVVQTIQFRNTFDTEGPLVPGLTPTEAVSRVGYFIDKCEELQRKRDLLDAVQKLLNIPLSPYPELEHTQEELSYLKTLYSNYQDFILFDEEFRLILWSEVDLQLAMNETEIFWTTFCSLPQEQQDWEASHKLCQGITHYRKILPLLNKLHNKEIRSRHWLQIMAVTGHNFPLEARLFKLDHLLEADLLRFSADITNIIDSARREQELEQDFLSIEEEWSEQCFQFEKHQSSSLPLLSTTSSLYLLEHLETTQTTLVLMLMSPHINPLRHETAQWAGKLATITDVLQLWLTVQELWLSLQPVFNSNLASEDFPDESISFGNITEVWTALMNETSTIKNCIQCCITSEEPLLPVLLKLNEDLEKCKMSLSSYLTTKRQCFYRLYFIPDDALLSLLSNSLSTNLIGPYLGNLFGGVAHLVTDPASPSNIVAVKSVEGEELQLAQNVFMSANVEEWLVSLLSSTHSSIQQLLLQSMDSDLPSLEELVLYQLTQVACISLHHQWTKDSEQALASCRYDRRALPGLRSKFNNTIVMKLSLLLMRQSWKHSDEPVTPLHQKRLESLMTLSLWLRDLTDDLCLRKIRDAMDFEWIRFPRLLLHMSGSGEQEIKLHCLDVQLSYNNEFLGCKRLPVFSTRTNNYIISLSQAFNNNLGSCIVLPSGSKNSELVKGIAYLVGQFTPTLHCTSLTSTSAISTYLTGIAQDGCWSCMTNVHLLPKESLSLLSSMLNSFFEKLKNNQRISSLNNGLEMIKVNPSMAIFLTHTPSWSLPTSLTTIFRSFSFPFPDHHILLRSYCLALGLKGSKVLIHRLETLLTLIENQLPIHPVYSLTPILCHALELAVKRAHTSGGGGGGGGGGSVTFNTSTRPETTTATAALYKNQPFSRIQNRVPKPVHVNPANTSSSQSLNVATLREHALVAETIAVLLGARFTSQELPVFRSILEKVFYDCPDISSRITAPNINGNLSSFLQSSSCFRSQLLLLEEQAKLNGLTPMKNWLLKTEQVFIMSKAKHAIVLAGREASGKTSSLKTVVSTLNSKEGDKELKTVRLQKVYPEVFMDQSEVFGCIGENGTWRDGIFTALIRKSIKATQTTVWICFDGPLVEDWFNHLGELPPNKCLSLGNGEHIQIHTDTIKLVFETGQLSNASPVALVHCGVICFDSQVLGWRALASSWLKKRKRNEAVCLQRLFESTIDSVSQFILHKLDYNEKETEVSLFHSCLGYLTSLLNAYIETAEVFSELHVERIFLFSLIWSFGGVLLKANEREKFSQLLRQHTTSLPDDDTEYSVFDYYVDESGEWDVWQSKLPEERCQGVDLLGRVFVDTTTTVRIEMLLELALTSRRHVLLVGPHASGKTVILNHFLSSRALHFFKTESVRRLVNNGGTDSSDLHQFLKINLHHRQGYTYGPSDGRCLHVLLDDLHLPAANNRQMISSYEYLRQLTDDHGIYNLVKVNQLVTLEDVLFFGSLSTDKGATLLDPRLRRHFIIIPIDGLSEGDLTEIVPLALTNFTSLITSVPSQLFKSLAEASRLVYQSVSSIFKKSDTPGRQHYFFSLSSLESALPGLGYIPDASNHQMLINLWSSEMRRVYGLSLSREEDKKWLHETIKAIGQKCFPSEGENADAAKKSVLFSSISPQAAAQSNLTSKMAPCLNAMPSVLLHCIERWQQIEESVQYYITRYHEEGVSPIPLKLEMSDDNLSFIASVHRALKQARGNCILVGSLGQPILTLARLVLYISNYTTHTLPDNVTDSIINEIMKSLFRLAGLEGKQVALIVEEHHLKSPLVLGLLNSFLSACELPTLFTVEEMSGLIHALLPSIKRDFPSEMIDPEQYFTARICQNLRLIICVTPNCEILTTKAHEYQGMLQMSHIIWMEEGNLPTINCQVTWFLSESPLSTCIPDDFRPLLVERVSSIHYYMLIQAGSLEQTGPSLCQPSDMESTNSYCYLMEKMNILLTREEGGKGVLPVPYVGPLSLRNFLECLCRMYRERSELVKKQENNLNKALSTLTGVQDSVEEMQATLDVLKEKLYRTSLQSTDLLKQVTMKSCQLERIKALLGSGGPVLSAMRMVAEQKRLLSDNEEDDQELLAVFFNQLPNKGTRIEMLMERAKEKLKLAEKEERETRRAMARTKEQANYWQSKIDRNTIEQIKTLPNPPPLVGTIMELMLQLLQATPTTPLPPPPPPFNRRSSIIPTSKSSTEKDYWTQLQLAIGDSQHFLDLINNLKWVDGLSQSSVDLIESKLATKRNSEGFSRSEGTDSSGSEPPLVPSSSSLVTVAMARHTSESVAVMCEFAVSIVDYQYSFEPHHNAVKRVEKLKKDIEALKREVPIELTPEHHQQSHDPSRLLEEDEDEDASDNDLALLEEELTDLKRQFDESVMEKHNLSKTCQQLVTKLKLAKNLLESLHPRLEEWQQELADLPMSEVLLSTVTIAAAFLTYCGSLPTQSLQDTISNISTQCYPHSLSPHLTPMESLMTFLLTPSQHQSLSLEELPMDHRTVLTACTIVSEHTSQWPLVLDPLGMACRWLVTHYENDRKGRGEEEAKKRKESNVIVIQYNAPLVSTVLIQAVTEGKTLIVTGVDPEHLGSTADTTFGSIINCRRKLSKKKPLKILVDGREIDCSYNFRLILVTSSQSVPKLLSSQCSVILFYPECLGLHSRLLDEFLKTQGIKTFLERVQMRKDIHSYILKCDSIDQQLLTALGNEAEMEMEAKSINKLLSLNKLFEFSQENLLQSREQYRDMTVYQLSTFSSLANRAAIIIHTALLMSHAHPLYYTSIEYALNVFRTYITQAGTRIQGEDALSKLTRFGHTHFEKGYMELDKQVFSLLLALNIEADQGRASSSERSFFIDPVPGSKFIVRGLLHQLPYENLPVVNFGKKPYDWMNEDQWQKLLMLASHFEWIHSILHNLGRDGKETMWRTIGEGSHPETTILGLKLTPLQLLLLQWALRPERITQFALVFSAHVLEFKSLSPNYLDLQGTIKSLPVEVCPLLLYENDPQLYMSKLQHLTQKHQVPLSVYTSQNIIKSTEIAEIIDKINNLLGKNHWVVLQRVNECPPLMESVIEMLNSRQSRSVEGRLWLSLDINTIKNTPSSLLKHCYRIAMDYPKLPVNSLTDFLYMCGQDDIISLSPRTEWLPLLHSLAMFHIIACLRKELYPFSFQHHYPWTYMHLNDALAFILSEFVKFDSSGKLSLTPVSWSGIRYMITEVIYGSLVTSSVDYKILNALTEHWFHPGGPKKESGLYHVPTIFFTPNTRTINLIQAVENAMPPLVPNAMLCGLHNLPDIQIGWKSTLFSSLQYLHAIRESTKSYTPPSPVIPITPSLIASTGVSSRGFPQAMSAMSVISSAGKKGYHQGPFVSAHILDKLPSFIVLPVNLLSLHLDFTRIGVIPTAISSSILSKDLHTGLLRTVTKLLDGFVIGWKKDVLYERLRKYHTTATPFGYFIIQEATTLNRKIQLVNRDLQTLQSFLRGSTGDVFIKSPQLIQTALSLISLSVPSNWYEAVGSTTPPYDQWDLKEWLADLVMRFAFTDKVITWGIEKTSTYWLGAFFNPQSLLSIFHQSYAMSHLSNEQALFVGELTSRDKDHIRDPPAEGLFIYGVYLWGVHFEKTTNLELHDIPPRSLQASSFPVLHLSLKSSSTVMHNQSDAKPPFNHYIPCFHTRRDTKPLFYLKIFSNDITSNKWTLRNLTCTLRPF